MRSDTQAGLEFQGLTGVPVITLKGGAPGAALLALSGKTPVLVADPSAGQSMTEAARQALRRLDALLADNAERSQERDRQSQYLRGALARNSDRVDGILSGLERMTGGGGAKPLSRPTTVSPLRAPSHRPKRRRKASLSCSSRLRSSHSTPSGSLLRQAQPRGGSENPQWSDSIPKLLQAKIVESFENSNYLGAVARPIEGLNADYQLALDLRSFRGFQPAPAAGNPLPGAGAHVAFAAKIFGGDGRIVGSRTFEAAVPAPETKATGAAAALDQAFGKAVSDLVVWTAGII